MAEQLTENPAATAVQHAFDEATKPKVTRVARGQEKPVEAPKPPEPTPVAPTPEKPTTEAPKDAEPPSYKLPSFVLGEEAPKPVEVPKADEVTLDQIPKEAPADASEAVKQNWAKAHRLMSRQETELKDLRSKAAERETKGKAPDEATTQRIAQLEMENRQYKEEFQKTSIERHPAFIQQVIKPMQAAYADAKRIISEAGGDANALDRAIAVTGKSHYDAMDEILATLPESAKGELTATMRDYSRFAKHRENAMADAPRFAEEMRRQDEQRQLQQISQTKQGMEKQFNDMVRFLRDDAKFPLFKKVDGDDYHWWNQLGDDIVAEGRKLYLDNQDMTKVAEACVLAPAAMALNQMWQNAERRAARAEKELSSLRSSEPTLGSTGGGGAPSASDIKIPFEDVFLTTLKKQTGR